MPSPEMSCSSARASAWFARTGDVVMLSERDSSNLTDFVEFLLFDRPKDGHEIEASGMILDRHRRSEM